MYIFLKIQADLVREGNYNKRAKRLNIFIKIFYINCLGLITDNI
jgi:hypothetical protein